MELHPKNAERQVSDEKPVELDPISRALRENEDWYRDLVDHSQDLLCIHDLQGRLLSVNPAPARVLGYAVDELVNIPMREIVAPEFRNQFDAYLAQIAFKREARGLMAVVARTGERRIWEYHNTLRTEGVSSPIVRGMAHDITDRVRMERELRKREDDLKRAQSVAHIGSWSYDIVRNTVTFSDETCRIVGLQPASIFTPESAMEIIHPDDHQKVTTGWDSAVRAGHFDLEHRILVQGAIRWVQTKADIETDSDGRPIEAVGTIQDITDRKRALAALEASENRFRVVYESSPVGICLTETNTGRFIQVNPKYCEIVGRTQEDLLARDVHSITHPDDIARAVERSRQLIAGEIQRYDTQKRYLRPDGSVRWVSVQVARMYDQDHVSSWNTAIVQDVTELREMTEQLRRAKERLTEEKLYLEQEIVSEIGFGEIIGKSQALRAVMEQVGHVASSDATVLLLGDTGTGKELVARAIHEKSTRKNSSFIKVNCAAIPSGLLESELFGHEKGAFTGAVTKKIGRLELADRGTLFLDEIGEIPLALQPKLLRVLQDQEFERLGGTQTIRVNFRLIAATNRDLSQSMKEKQFRSDLYYRLNVFPVRVPLLRDRREDIPSLVEHFVQRFASRMNRTITSVPKRTMDALTQWDWPGNVRELENFVERSVILTHGSVLAAPISELITVRRDDASGDSLKAKEREHIQQALRQTRGQLSGPRGAAARLGLPRSTLQWKLKQLGIDPRQYRD
jgi:PAS domain S-box-containing protein